MSKIVYLIEQPLDPRNYDRFGIQTWIDRGWTVEVWDLTGLAYPRVWEDFIESGVDLSKFEGYFPLASKSQLDYRFSRLGKVEYFIDLTGDNWCSVRVKMSLKRRGAKRVICATGAIPLPDEGKKTGILSRLAEEFSKGTAAFGWLVGALVHRLTNPFIRPDLLVAAGEKSIPSSENSQKVIRAHNFDYDIYLKLTKSPCTNLAANAVFLDQNICFHPDYNYRKVVSYATPEKYFPTICSGLRTISNDLGVPFQIAAHPRLSRQKKYIDYFEGIPVEYGKTAELISNCRFVVCHYSTAIQFAVLFRKPVIFVTTDELASSAAGKYIETFASTLGKSVINLDGELGSVDWRRQLHIDPQKYDEYINEYVKTGDSPEIPHWDIVIDHLEKSCRRLTADPLEEQAHVNGR
jgi:hypothetical protein